MWSAAFVIGALRVKKGARFDKSNPKLTKLYSGHLHIGSKLLEKFHEPNSSGSLDILLTKSVMYR